MTVAKVANFSYFASLVKLRLILAKDAGANFLKLKPMLNLYKKERIQEEKLEIEDDFEIIPYSSVSLFSKYNSFDETLLSELQFTKDSYYNITLEMFKSSMVSLLISKKIDIVYFVDKKSVFFNQFEYNSEGFKIYITKKTIIEEGDILENAILSALQKINLPDSENFPSVVYDTINQYIGKEIMNKPHKKFILRYLNDYSKKNSWFKLKSNKKWWGIKSEIEIAEFKKGELMLSLDKIKVKFMEFNRKDILLRKFLIYIEEVVVKDFSSRIPAD